MKPYPDEVQAARAADLLSDWGFEFDDPGDRWMERLREAETPSVLGRIGPYELEREVSRGGQGVVFRARQPGTNRSIALKRLLAGEFATAAMLRRFEREVESAALLNHPNIVTVYGMDVVDGTPICAMEWIDGVPTTEWARDRGPEEKLRLFLRICEAVQHAHGRGVLHRDLKPSNILVDDADQPHVLDFGLAKRTPLSVDDGAGGRQPASMTKSAEVFGTPAYAAPEQLDGSETRIDARADVYSLGVVLFEMLTDASPYGEWDGIPDLLLKVGTVRAPRPSSIDPRLGVDLDTVVRKALEPEPGQRYRSVAAFAEDVLRSLNGEPILAVPPSSWLLLRKLVERNRLVSGLAALVVVTLGTFAVVSARQARRLAIEKANVEAAHAEVLARVTRLAALLAFVPDCVHVSNRELSAYVAKPGTVLDASVGFSSANPHYTHAGEPTLEGPEAPAETGGATRPGGSSP